MINRRSMLKLLGLAPVAAPIVALASPEAITVPPPITDGEIAVNVLGSADRELMSKMREIAGRAADEHFANYLRQPYRRG
jgi:hypothetical protein